MTSGVDVASLLHELSQPVAVLDGYLHALHRTAHLEPEAAACLAAARDAARELACIIERAADEVVASSDGQRRDVAHPPGRGRGPEPGAR